MNDYRYDSHCHIFPMGKFALAEGWELAKAMCRKRYPWTKPGRNLGIAHGDGDILDIIRKYLAWVAMAWGQTLGSERDNFELLEKGVGNAFKNSKPRVVPLMMDVFYMFAYSLGEGEDAAQPLRVDESLNDADEAKARELWNTALDEFCAQLKAGADKPCSTNTLAGALGDAETASRILATVEEYRSGAANLADEGESDTRSARGYHCTAGYCKHMDRLLQLVKEKNKTPADSGIFPFVAIDPRRPGIIDALVKGKFTTGSPRFYGVKLYPRLGYHPQCKPLLGVYDYCNANNIPITFHCGRGGFPPSGKWPIEDWPYNDLGDPDNFREILKDNKNLRIDFAHVGSNSDGKWTEKIAGMTDDPLYRNLYTDLSCYTDKQELIDIREMLKNHPNLADRILFGTDYPFLYMSSVDVPKYYRNFTEVFDEATLKKFTCDNPARFLGV